MGYSPCLQKPIWKQGKMRDTEGWRRWDVRDEGGEAEGFRDSQSHNGSGSGMAAAMSGLALHDT